MIGTGIRLSLALLAVNVAACGGGAPQEVPESRWVTWDDGGAQLEQRPPEEGEWVAKCRRRLGGVEVEIISECTDDPIIAQKWAEAAEKHFDDGALCGSREALGCFVTDDLTPEDVTVLPADE